MKFKIEELLGVLLSRPQKEVLLLQFHMCFPPTSTFHHAVMGNLWATFPAGQKEMPHGSKSWGRENAWAGRKQLQREDVLISPSRSKYDAATIMRASWDLVPSSDL